VSDVARYWDGQTSSLDDGPDHGLRDPAIRSASAALLIPLIPPPARSAPLP
jgi:hypothetical protein